MNPALLLLVDALASVAIKLVQNASGPALTPEEVAAKLSKLADELDELNKTIQAYKPLP